MNVGKQRRENLDLEIRLSLFGIWGKRGDSSFQKRIEDKLRMKERRGVKQGVNGHNRLEMNKNNSQSEESEQTQDLKLRQLSEAISICPTMLFQLCSSSELMRKKIQEYNDLAVIKIESEQYNQALIYLDQAEKAISYIDTKGRRIDRALKLCVMQNQVCSYQRLWEVKRAYTYMDAIILSMQRQLEMSPQVEIQQIYFSDNLNQKDSLKLCIARLTQMSIYYLQFSAIASQLKYNSIALATVKKALKALKTVSEKCIKLEMHSSKPIYESLTGSMLAELATIPEEVELDKASSYLIETSKTLAKLRRGNTRRKNMTDKIVISFRQFTIGDVMQVSPITLSEMESRLNMKEQISTLGRLYKAMYVSICFFAMATQNRLISDIKSHSQFSKKNSDEFKKSELFHLKAIYLAAKFIPCQSRYLQHILSSFKKHYDHDLLESAEELIQEVSSIGVDSHNAKIDGLREDSIHKKKCQKIVVFRSTDNKMYRSSRSDLKISKSKSLSKKGSVHRKSQSKSQKKGSKIKVSNQKQLKPSNPSLNTVPTINSIKSTLRPGHMAKSHKKLHCVLSSREYQNDKKEKGKIRKKVKGKETSKEHSQSKSKSKSKSKSHSKSYKKLTKLKDDYTEKEKAKKKNAKMKQEYFMKPVGDKKKKKDKSCKLIG